jgi:lipopolysaccharide transport system ATP-binding protein
MSTAIKIDHLSKEYRLGVINHGMLYKDIQSWLARKLGKPDPNAMIGADRFADNVDRFWALKDICLEIGSGDRIGVIGKNGAGKSTLLKILSRITAPTEGLVRIKGRVASLLEVGTGFHPELTGRENVYLNGAILGMKKRDVAKKMDEIVAFSEIEQFIDTPVKRYSSGMYVRLAFSVAAHFDSDILLADEVLAVGDAAFQSKCLGKMDEVSKSEGRTILFVSHNMNFIDTLCSKVIRLEKGRVVENMVDAHTAIVSYLGLGGSEGASLWVNPGDSYFNPEFMPTRFAITNEDGSVATMPVPKDEKVFVEIEGNVDEIDRAMTLGYALYDGDGRLLYWTYQTDTHESAWPKMVKGKNKLRSAIPLLLLNEGTYSLRLMCSIHFKKWLVDPEVDSPRVTLVIQGGLSPSVYWVAKRPGIVAPLIEWKSIT